MALPELLLPPGTPAFLANGHAVELVPQHADVAMRTGHSRKRRIYTAAPRFVDVALRLTQAQMTAFAAWFGGPLQAGTLSFTAAVANQGPGLLYWQARFEAPYSARPNETASDWTVTARLRLVGEDTTTLPAATSLAGDTTVQLVGAAAFAALNTLAGDTLVALVAGGAALAGDTLVALVSIVNGAPASAVDFDKRWIWMRYPYSFGRTADVNDLSQADQRSWFGV